MGKLWLASLFVACFSALAAAVQPAENRATGLRPAKAQDVAPGSAANGPALMQAASRLQSVSFKSVVEVPRKLPEVSLAEAVLPELDDSHLSAPSLLAHLVGKATSKLMDGFVGTDRRDLSLLRVPLSVKNHWGVLLFGLAGFICGVAILWFNELRNVKMDTLLSRGLAECETINAEHVDIDTRGSLVHVQGKTQGMMVVEDPQFHGAAVSNCLKLQSVVEVYEWVQTVKVSPKPSDKKGQLQYSFHKEWTTIHRNSFEFQRSAGKASPENPSLPRALSLGTFTSVCKDVHLGGFTLPDDMMEQIRAFEPAMRYMPPTVQACGLVFYANKDGYYYARPSTRAMWSANGGPSTEPNIGDLRARFLCVPQGVATVVAVHCLKHGVETFVPYRAIPRGCCTSVDSDKQRLVEEGSRSRTELHESDRDLTPCLVQNRTTVSVLCCPCSAINRICAKEIVTDEIYYISESLDSVEKPFEHIVPRGTFRVWSFRLIGWLVDRKSVV